MKIEVDRLCKLGVLKRVNRSEWAAPTFLIPKKDGTVRFISDFRELNKRLKRKPYPLPTIQDLLMKLEGFQYGTSLDLNMGYYHIELHPDSKELCTIVLPWGKYEYQRLPMGLCNSPDIFQERMSNLFSDLENVRAYIDDLLNITSGDYNDHLNKLEIIFQRLQKAGLKVNAKKSFFARSELEYLGYWITREGIQPLPKKVEAIHNIATPTKCKELRRFIGMVNYYRDMWVRRSDILAPLAALTSDKTPWKWTEEHQTAFETMKKVITRETMLAYPKFNEPFHIYTDASDKQLGAVISQDDRPIAFYSQKLAPAQTRYMTTERELLAIVETLKEFRNILFGQKLIVHTDHKNLLYKNFNTHRVMRWHLIVEEFGPEFRYIEGPKNVVANALSRLDMQDCPLPQTPLELAEFYGLDEVNTSAFPIRYSALERAQSRDKSLLKAANSGSNAITTRSFHGGGKTHDLICLNDKIIVPKPLQRRIVEWYHETLLHPGETRTEQTIKQHFHWKHLRQHVHEVCSKCPTCQMAKRQKKKYGHLPPKEAEAEPWNKLCVDLIGPYTIKNQSSKPLTLWCMTMIDPATGWFEMREIPNKRADTIANIVEQAWLTRYPWPTQVIFDQGSKFMAEFAAMVRDDYGIKRKPITKRNPQANAMIERVHQVLGNLIRTCDVNNTELDLDDPWSGILAATMFAVRATYHTTTQATPSQLVFGRDAILNTKFEANWQLIKQRKQTLINTNNKRENEKRIPHQYHVGDKVLVHLGDVKSKFAPQYEGPFIVTGVNNNGTLQVQKGSVTETVNIRIVHPFRE